MGYIFWLASYPKSGNTWLRVFLRNLLDVGARKDLNSLHERFPYDVGAAYYRAVDPRPLNELSSGEVLALRSKVQRSIAQQNPHLTFVKTHSALSVVDGHHLIDPDVTIGAIYLVRNPLDVAVSFSFHIGKTIDEAIDLMNLKRAVDASTLDKAQEYFGSWSENVESWTRGANPSIFVVRYEDMIQAPHKTFKVIARALGQEPVSSDLNRAIQASSFRVLQAQEARNGFSERPPFSTGPFFRNGKAGEGKKLLTASQVDRLVLAHHEQMKRFGYLP